MTSMFNVEHPLCLIATDIDFPNVREGDERRGTKRIGSLEEMHSELKALTTRVPTGARMLDLIGHSTRDHHHLRFGDTPIDMRRPSVARLFEAIRSEGLLEQLGVTALRLLGCSTAVVPSSQWTMQQLARTLELPVYGSRKDLSQWH